jgi:cytohesin
MAAISGHLPTTKVLLEEGCPLDTLSKEGRSVLHNAAEGGNALIVQELIERGCDVDAINNDSSTPLHIAAANGKTEAAVELIRHGAAKSIVSGSLGTPLHLAAIRGHITTLRALLALGCQLDILSTDNRTVLHHAAEGGNIDVVKELISRHCEVNSIDKENLSPLHTAAVSGHTGVVAELLRQGATKAMVAGKFGTPLHQAASKGHFTTVKLLLDHGCPVNVLTTKGCNVLHNAAVCNDIKVVKALVESGCDVDATDVDNYTPIHMATMLRSTKFALELMKHCNNFFISAGINGTPFQLSCFTGDKKVMQSIMDRCPGAINSLNSIGGNALHVAAQANKHAILSILIENGLPVNTLDMYGLSPLHYAAGFGGWESYKLLVDNGANEKCEAYGFLTPLTFAHVTGNDRITSHFSNPIHSFEAVFNNLTISKGASNVEYFIALNHWKNTSSKGYLRSRELLKHDLSINIHNVLSIGALLGDFQIIDFIGQFLRDNPLLQKSFMSTESTITPQFVQWLFQLTDAESIVPVTFKPGKTLGPLHLAMISQKFYHRRSHLVLHTAPHKFLHFINRFLSDSLLTEICCRQHSCNWPIHPIYLAEILKLQDIADVLHKAGLAGFHLPLETSVIDMPNLLMVGKMMAQIKIMGMASTKDIKSFLKYQLSSLPAGEYSLDNDNPLYEEQPQVVHLVKNIVDKVQHQYTSSELEKLTLSLNIPRTVLKDVCGMPLKVILKKLLMKWLDISKNPTWIELLNIFDDYETATTMRSLRKSLDKELFEWQMSSPNCLLTLKPDIPFTPSFLLEVPTSPIDSLKGSPQPVGKSQKQEITLYSVPTDKDLIDVLVPLVEAEWYNFGLYLGLESNILDEIREKKRAQVVDCCIDILSYWMGYHRGCGSKRRCWNTLLIALHKSAGKVQMDKVLKIFNLNERDIFYEDFISSDAIQYDDCPNLVQLIEHVIPHIEGAWNSIMLYFGLSLEKVSSIYKDFRSVPHSCREAFKHLLTGKNLVREYTPFRWCSLFDAVMEYAGVRVSDRIKRNLQNPFTTAVSCSMPTSTFTDSQWLKELYRPIALNSMPTIKELVEIIVPIVAAEWYNFGLYIGFEPNILNGIRKSKRDDGSDCCNDVLNCWIQGFHGSGSKRRSWNTVMIAVEKSVGKYQMQYILYEFKCTRHDLSYTEFTCSIERQHDDSPKLVDIVEHVVPLIENMWNVIAISLGVTFDKVTSIYRDYNSNAHRCRETFNQLLTGRVSSTPCTWNMIFEIISHHMGFVVTRKIKKSLLKTVDVHSTC